MPRNSRVWQILPDFPFENGSLRPSNGISRVETRFRRLERLYINPLSNRLDISIGSTTNAVRTFEYKAVLNKLAHLRLDHFLEQQRQLYNAGLQECIDAYQKTRDTHPLSIGKFDQFKSLTELRRDLPEFAQFHVGCQRTALMRLDEAYKRFVKQGGFPRFKKYGSVNSFDAHGIGVKHTNRRGSIAVKGIGRIKWKLDDRYAPKRVKLVRVSRQPQGVYVQLVCEVELDARGADDVVGIDVGVKDRAVLSNGACIEKARRKVSYLKRRQRLVSRSRKGSGSRKRNARRLRKEHHRIRTRERIALHRDARALSGIMACT